MIRTVPHVWNEPVDYQCNQCGHKGEGQIEVEETGSEWCDLFCAECDSDNLRLERR